MPTKPEMVALGVTVRRLRQAQNLTIEALAYKAGLSASHLCRIERGHVDPRMATLCDLAQALGVMFSQLVIAAEGEGEA